MNIDILNKELIVKRLLKETTKTDKGHWIFTGYKRPSGYGRLNINNTIIDTHRLSAYIYLGLDLDSKIQHALHKPECDNKSCWNPDHLYIGDAVQNAVDARNKHGGGAKKRQFCFRGHKLSEDNIYIRKYCVMCKICHKARNEKYLERKRNAK